MALTCFLMWVSVTIISHRVDRIKDALFMPSREALKDWGEYLAISLPATVMLCAEWWFFEIMVLFAS